ncbi:MAG: YicC family protein [Magnetococcales bacterium]|nr:YicC family protein [Magnetococcales bacterium]
MPQSMTGYGRAEGVVGEWQAAWRLKSVNQRFLELSFRIPEGFGELEGAARALLKERVGRGHLDVTLSLGGEKPASGGYRIDRGVLVAVAGLERELRKALPDKGRGRGRGRLSLERLAQWPGVVRERRPLDLLAAGEKAARDALMALLEEAVNGLLESRRREGAALAEALDALLRELEGLAARVGGRLPEVRRMQEQRLRERVGELLGHVAEEPRMAQELAILLNRMEVGEELDRLGVHVRECRSLLGQEAAVGRKLDFLCQELNRETNTLCSKSQDGELTRLGVEMKVVVEKIREQVQNLE